MPILIECVPNFSEGRRPEVVAALAAALGSVPGAAVLHQTADAHHHRSVITLAGQPDAVLEAAFRGIALAAEQIDLTQHRGVHPRLGAADVVPLVPLRGITLAECAALARQLGARVGHELGLPVYLYEAAATRPERYNLADVRRGGYEHLRQTITTPEHEPDFGPPVVGPAGACIIGARSILIAFNVFLQTADVGIARAIAGRIREANGGLPGIKALGFLVGGQAQVSLNVIAYAQQTSVCRAVWLIGQLAAEYGTAIARSEVIGLIPRAALERDHGLLPAAADLPADILPEMRYAHALHLHGFDPATQLLETALARAGL